VGTLNPIIVIGKVVSESTSAERTYRVAISILAAAGGVALLYYGQVFFITVIIAFMIAFLLEPAVRLFMRMRMPRGLASFLVCALWLGCLYFAGLALYTEGIAMLDDLPAYGARINELVDSAAVRVESVEKNVYRTLVPRRFQDQDPTQPSQPETPGVRGKASKKAADPQPSTPPVQEVRVRQEPTAVVSYVYDYLRSFYNVLLMASFIPFLVYFILSWGDHLRARLLFTLEGEPRYTLAKALDGVGDMVRAYVVGNFLLGVLLSVASSILFASVRLPYWPVVGPMSGFLSLVPYIGMPLALIPALVAALPTGTTSKYLFLLVSVGLLHLFALNLLYPKFVGSRVHLNPLAVTIALMLWGMLWGGIGLILAIPITAGLKPICDNVSSLKPYGRLLGDQFAMSRQFWTYFIISLALVAAGVGIAFYANRGAHLAPTGEILKVRSLADGDDGAIVFADVRITNWASIPFVVNSVQMSMETLQDEVATATPLSKSDVEKISKAYKLIGPKYNDVLGGQDKIPPGKTIDFMAAGRFNFPPRFLEPRKTLRLKIQEVDGAVAELVEKGAEKGAEKSAAK